MFVFVFFLSLFFVLLFSFPFFERIIANENIGLGMVHFQTKRQNRKA